MAGLSYNPWGDLILATIIAVISLAVVFWLIERANEETLRLAHRTIREGIGADRHLRPCPFPFLPHHLAQRVPPLQICLRLRAHGTGRHPRLAMHPPRKIHRRMRNVYLAHYPYQAKCYQ